MVTHSSTSRPVQCLCMAERTGCPVLTDLWSYVQSQDERVLIVVLHKAEGAWLKTSGKSESDPDSSRNATSHLICKLIDHIQPSSGSFMHVLRPDPSVANLDMSSTRYGVTGLQTMSRSNLSIRSETTAFLAQHLSVRYTGLPYCPGGGLYSQGLSPLTTFTRQIGC